MRTLNRWTAVAVCLLVWGVSGCADVDVHTPEWRWDGFDGAWPDADSPAEVDFTISRPAGAALTLHATGGSVEIVGEAGIDEVRIEGTRRVWSWSAEDARARLDDLRVDVARSGESLVVTTRRPARNQGRRYEVDYRITVPRESGLSVDFAAGPLVVREIQGDLRIAGVSGEVALEGIQGDVQARLVTGAVEAEIALPPDGVVDLVNTAGDILLKIPAATSATLEASTATGRVRVENLQVYDEDPRASVLRGTLVDGRGRIALGSTSGDITVRGIAGGEGGR